MASIAPSRTKLSRIDCLRHRIRRCRNQTLHATTVRDGYWSCTDDILAFIRKWRTRYRSALGYVSMVASRKRKNDKIMSALLRELRKIV
jgi:hypothetical protein